MNKQILVIEDDTTLNQLIARVVGKLGHKVVGARTWGEANAFLEENEPSLIITDMRLPDGDSISRLKELVAAQPVIVLTAYGSVRNAVDAIKAGAFEYLMKPISPEELSLVVKRALETAELRQEFQFCKQRMKAEAERITYMIGESAALQQVRELISDVAPTDMTVLIQGESGSGKELVARAIHESSPRAERNFVAVDCCTIQEKLFESELFGHERGSFTGADRQKKGLIEGAAGGTLFLDEIGEIDASLQAKLLRVLETGIFRRLGGTKDLVANVRIVAATNRDLEAMAREGRFRADLYYRLNGFSITAPPLRERREDIPHLAAHFLNNRNFSQRLEKGLGPDSLRKLTSYDWPGNVRELKNVIERAIILSRDKRRIAPEHLAFGSSQSRPPEPSRVNLSFDHEPTMEELESEYLRMLLQKFSGHRAKVAEVMGISERSVYRMLSRYGMVECES